MTTPPSTTRLRTACVALLAAALAAAGLAASREAEPEVLAIRARRIETMAGRPVENGVIVVRGGTIVEVGPASEVRLPVSALVVDVGDGVVIPGLVNPFAQAGLSSPVATVDAGGGGRGGIFGRRGGGGIHSMPEHRVVDEIYPFDRVYRDLAEAGYAALALAPGGGVCGGQGALVRPVGASVSEMVVVENLFLSLAIELSTPGKEALKSLFESGVKFLEAEEEARRKAAQPEAKGADKKDEKTADTTKEKTEEKTEDRKRQDGERSDEKERERSEDKKEETRERRGGRADLQKPAAAEAAKPKEPERRRPDARTEPVVRLLRGEIPGVVRLRSAAEVAHFLELTREWRGRFPAMRFVPVLSSDAWRVLERLSEEKLLSVVLAPDITFELTTRNRMNLPDLFARAGFTVACTPSFENVTAYRGALFRVSELVKYGMDREAALRALTASAADVLGVADRVGTIQPGREASLVVMDGDPLDPTARIERVLVSGRWVVGEVPRTKGIRK